MDDDRSTFRTLLRSARSLTGSPPPFDPDVVPADPVHLFMEWFELASGAGVPEPHAVTLATADGDGMPDARVLVLKDVTSDGAWTFASSGASAKGRQLAASPRAALAFFWPQQLRSIRLRGPVEIQPEPVRRADFAARSASARAIALAGGQSEPMTDPADLRTAIESAAALLRREPDAVAADWIVWGMRPDSVEFWQGDPTREHLRLQYRRVDDGWATLRLRP